MLRSPRPGLALVAGHDMLLMLGNGMQGTLLGIRGAIELTSRHAADVYRDVVLLHRLPVRLADGA